MSMKKGHMMELIKSLIHDAAVEQLTKKRAANPHDPPSLSDEELDKILFYGGMEPLHESFDGAAKIGTSDVKEFENQMYAIISNIPNAILSFDKQPNGHSILLKNAGSSVDVVSSGKITFGSEGAMTWMFSIPNGLRLSTDGLQITQANRDLIADLSNYYTTWQKDWRQKLLAPDGGETSDAMEAGVDAPTTGATPEGSATGASAPPEGAPTV